MSSLDNVTGLKSETDLVKLSLFPQYRIQNIILDVMSEKRSVSSILRTNSINSEHSNRCFWCRIEFSASGLYIPHTSNALCIRRKEYYSNVQRSNKCSYQGSNGAMVVDTSVQCMNITDNLAVGLQGLQDDGAMRTLFRLAPTKSYSVLESSVVQPSHGVSEAKLQDGVLGIVTLTSAHSDENIASKITHSLHTILTVAMTSTKTQAKTTPSSSQTGHSVSLLDEFLVATTQNSTDDNMDATVPRSSFEGALYAAIVVCILFVGVIVVLVIVIVCLSKRKCSCLSRVGSRTIRQLVRLRAERRETREGESVQTVQRTWVL